MASTEAAQDTSAAALTASAMSGMSTMMTHMESGCKDFAVELEKIFISLRKEDIEKFLKVIKELDECTNKTMSFGTDCLKKLTPVTTCLNKAAVVQKLLAEERAKMESLLAEGKADGVDTDSAEFREKMYPHVFAFLKNYKAFQELDQADFFNTTIEKLLSLSERWKRLDNALRELVMQLQQNGQALKEKAEKLKSKSWWIKAGCVACIVGAIGLTVAAAAATGGAGVIPEIAGAVGLLAGAAVVGASHASSLDKESKQLAMKAGSVMQGASLIGAAVGYTSRNWNTGDSQATEMIALSDVTFELAQKLEDVRDTVVEIHRNLDQSAGITALLKDKWSQGVEVFAETPSDASTERAVRMIISMSLEKSLDELRQIETCQKEASDELRKLSNKISELVAHAVKCHEQYTNPTDGTKSLHLLVKEWEAALPGHGQPKEEGNGCSIM